MALMATGSEAAPLSSPPSVELAPAAAMPPPSPVAILADDGEVSHSPANPPLSPEPNVSGAPLSPIISPPCAAAVPPKRQADPEIEPEELPTVPTIPSPSFLVASSTLPAPGQASQQVVADEQIPSVQETLAALQGYESESLDEQMEVDDENKVMEE
ncbi:hypothetical protein OG21DRAFT_1487269 [Imleria badia]|nr:hypothetical protein OG21DRAFT_1487269 [Imleria badia]